MNNFQKFAAQQLTKQQMNDVRGGELYMCTFDTASTQNAVQYIEASDPASAESILRAGGTGYIDNVRCVLSRLDDFHL